ncbi:MAG: hypothetical protein AB1560_09895 [Pseudomonadota bacterium]
MRSASAIILFLASILSVGANADCIRNQYGKVVCGKGNCETDIHGKVFCADAGGGAVKDKYGKVQCGVGYCAKDYLEQVWCSKEPGGSAAVDSYGKVKCLGGCEIASSKRCREAQ